jgi:hypothetical protein
VKRVQGFKKYRSKGTWVKGCKRKTGSGVQEKTGAKVKGYKKTRVQGCKGERKIRIKRAFGNCGGL